MLNILDVVTPGQPHYPVVYEPTNNIAITITITSIVVILIILTIILIIVNKKRK